MCLGYPAKIISTDGNQAVVEHMGASRSVSVELIENAKKGDFVIIHAGIAITRMPEDEALATREAFDEVARWAGEV
jgi:hydrogenase expression/formation protein HypC